MKEQFEIWMAGLPSRWGPKGAPVVIRVSIKKTEKQVRVLRPHHDDSDNYETHNGVVGYRTLLSSNDPCLQHRTPEAAVEYWHKQNAKRIAELKAELAELEALNAKTPKIRMNKPKTTNV